jgi:hypothetical protein
MNSISFTTEDWSTSRPVHHIWVSYKDTNHIGVYAFKTHKEATKFVDYYGSVLGLECDYFHSFKLHTIEKTEKHCKNEAFDDKNTLWEVIQDDKKSVFKNDD